MANWNKKRKESISSKMKSLSLKTHRIWTKSKRFCLKRKFSNSSCENETEMKSKGTEKYIIFILPF